MEDKYCAEKHRRIDEKLDTQDRRLNNHAERIDKMEQNFHRMDERMANLITEMSKLNSILRWIFGLGATTLVGFLFRAIEKAVL